MKLVTNILKPGDCLLYWPASLFGWVIAVKSWTWISHVEVYAGGGLSWASRDGIGVGLYPLRLTELEEVRRLVVGEFNWGKATDYFTVVKGQGYDWLGLLCFTLAVAAGSTDRQFCSEFALNLYRAAGCRVLAPECDPDHTAPSEFQQTPAMTTVWKA